MQTAQEQRTQAIEELAKVIRNRSTVCGKNTIKFAIAAGVNFDRIGLLPRDPFYYALLFRFPDYIPNWFQLEIPSLKPKKPRTSRLERRQSHVEEMVFVAELAPLTQNTTILLHANNSPNNGHTNGHTQPENGLAATITYLDGKPDIPNLKPREGAIIRGAMNRLAANRQAALKQALTPPKENDSYYASMREDPDPEDVTAENHRRMLLKAHDEKTGRTKS